MIIDKIENAGKYGLCDEKWQLAFSLAAACSPANYSEGRDAMDFGIHFNRFEYITKSSEDSVIEVHQKYADVMFMAEGEEYLLYKPSDELKKIITPFKEEDDVLIAAVEGDEARLPLKPGMFAVFMPGDGHSSGIAICAPTTVKKCVVKVPIE